jgi:pyruvate/2-oxoglutarate dehydrogenase complex dihydrolipoamide dehydrogenase (E3) component
MHPSTREYDLVVIGSGPGGQKAAIAAARLQFHLRDLAVTFWFGEEVTAVNVGASSTVTTLASGKQIPAETVLYSAGRQGQTGPSGPGQRRAADGQPLRCTFARLMALSPRCCR